MSKDTIYREDAIRWVKTECNPYGKPTLDFESGKKVIEHLEHMPSADRPQEWIPCSERLPEEEGEYLVTARLYAFDSSYYDVGIAYCSPNKKWFRISNCEIVAWMPRPQPWKGADDE